MKREFYYCCKFFSITVIIVIVYLEIFRKLSQKVINFAKKELFVLYIFNLLREKESSIKEIQWKECFFSVFYNKMQNVNRHFFVRFLSRDHPSQYFSILEKLSLRVPVRYERTYARGKRIQHPFFSRIKNKYCNFPYTLWCFLFSFDSLSDLRSRFARLTYIHRYTNINDHAI